MSENIEIKINIGDAIKKGLEQKGWSQKKLADVMGVSSALVSGWINNKKTPMGDDLIKIALLLEIVPLLFPVNQQFEINNDRQEGSAGISQEVRYELEKMWKEIDGLKKLVHQ